MASVYKKGRDKGRKGTCWYISYDDERGIRKTVKGFTEKRATEELAKELERHAKLQKHGLVDEGAAKLKTTRKATIEEILAMFEVSIKASTPKHVSLTMSRLRRVFVGCGFRIVKNIDSEKAVEYLNQMKNDGKIGHKTFNHYLQALNSFGNWCVRTRRLLSNPFNGLRPLNTEVDIRHKRRALTSLEFSTLVKSARESGVSIQCYDGEVRARNYIMSYLTGLRRKELGSLTPSSFKLSDKSPTLIVQAACSKHRKKDVLPLHPELVSILPEWLEGLAPDEQLFPKLAKRKTWLMVKKDLERAGLPYVNDDGIADFHAAGRHSHITALIKSGASLPEACELARHSDIRMTMRYTHIGLEEQSKALGQISWKDSKCKKAIDTPGLTKPDAASVKNSGQRHGSGNKRFGGHSLSPHGTGNAGSSIANQKENPGRNRGFGVEIRNLSLPVNDNSKAEDTGVEPATLSGN